MHGAFILIDAVGTILKKTLLEKHTSRSNQPSDLYRYIILCIVHFVRFIALLMVLGLLVM